LWMFARDRLQPRKLTVSLTVSWIVLSRKTKRDTVMVLTDTRARTAKPSAKPYKLSDGGGM
jgi:hypothetical protein